ncbi:MAG: winged helix-turn-helix domain-containing protein [Blastocatellia bacterium]
MSKQSNKLYEFDGFLLNLVEKVLSKDGKTISLTPKAFDTLTILVERRGRLVEKDELIRLLWPENFVEESSLSQNIYLLRKALGEEAKFIETVPRRGYRFVCNVREVPDESVQQNNSVHSFIREDEPGVQERLVEKTPNALPPRRLPRVLALSLISVFIFFTIWFFLGRFKQPDAGFQVRTIAVLPFKFLGEESRDEHLGLGISDAMIARFSALQQISVRPTSSIFKYAGKTYDPATVGRELGVDAVLEGTIQHVGDRVRVTVQLTSVPDGRSLWAEKFDEKFTNVFALQDSISDQATRALKLRMTTNEKRQLTRHYTEDFEAYQAYARGIFFWNKRTEDGLTRGIEYFKQAIEKDPDYALAWAGMADAYAVSAYLDYKILPAEAAYQKARDAATKANELDQTIAEAHNALSIVKAYSDCDFPGAEEEVRKAIALQPNNATAHQRYAIYLRDQARLDESLKEVQYAEELDPLSPTIGTNLAYVFYLQREYERAERQCRKVLELEPDHFQTLLVLGMTCQQQQKYQEAIALLEKARRQTKGKGGVYFSALETLGTAYARAGFKQKAEEIIAELKLLPENQDYIAFYQALVYTGLGEIDRALTLLEASSGGWDVPPIVLTLDPRYDNVRADYRFGELLKR